MNEFQLDATSRKQRRTAISQHPTLTGLDFIEVNLNQLQLSVHFIPTARVGKSVVPADIKSENIRITSGQSTTPLSLNLADTALEISGDVLRINLINAWPRDRIATDDSSLYTLELVNLATVDRFFTHATFSLDAKSISDFDPIPSPLRSPKPSTKLEIDYLARDYSSFRQLMFDRLSVLMPQWKEHHPADLSTVLVEVLAYVGDRLSYYQDAVATEAYLSTARRRISVKRHAQLIDYRMHEGCNARAWVQIQIRSDKVFLPARTLLATQTESAEATLPWSTYQALTSRLQVFETLHSLDLVQVHNQLPLYNWGFEEFYLPKGATSAILDGGFPNLKPGDVLILEEILSPITGQAEDANINHRHPIRLTKVTVDDRNLTDPLQFPPKALTEIEWSAADALPFPLFISRRQNGQVLNTISVARGNIVLAEHGQRIMDEQLPIPNVREHQRYRPRLQQPELTHAVPYDHTQAQHQPANLAMVQEPRDAIPMINLYENGETWWARRDLLSSDRFAYDFVVETESDGFAYLRFGDGVRGKRPHHNSHLSATYRVGNGTRGNVGQEAIAHLIPIDPASLSISEHIIRVRNPLPAQGGTDPETLEQVRFYAPQVFRSEQQRCINADDYKWMTERHPEVQQASAVLRWTGSWYTAFVAVKRRGNQPIDPAFQQTLLHYLERYRLAGYDLKIIAPQYVPIDIVLTVKVATGHFASTVKQSLMETFSNADLPNGHQGFFHPDRFTFGQPVYFSQVVQTAMQVPGVAGVYLPKQESEPPGKIKFQRWGTAAQDELHNGIIPISPLEIARLDNIASAPGNGRIEFNLEGGL